jgi:hypothetical protein
VRIGGLLHQLGRTVRCPQQAAAQRGVHPGLVGGKGAGIERAELARTCLGGRVEVAVGVHRIGEARDERGVGRHCLARLQQRMHRGAAATRGDDLDAHRRGHAEHDLRHGDRGGLFHQHLVGEQRQHRTAAHCFAAHHREQWLREVHHGEQRAQQPFAAETARFGAELLPQVRTGREDAAAGAGEEYSADLGGLRGVHQRGDKSSVQLAVQRVRRLWPVQCEAQDAAFQRFVA